MSPTLYTAKNTGGNDNGDSTTMVITTTMANNGIGFGVRFRVSVLKSWDRTSLPTMWQDVQVLHGRNVSRVVVRRYSVCEEGRGLNWQLRVITEMCSESGYGVIDGVGGRTEYLRDGICPESESEKVVKKGVPLQRRKAVISVAQVR